MDRKLRGHSKGLGHILNRINLKLRPKLILIFLVVKVIPILLLTVIAWNQISKLGELLHDIAVEDSSQALTDGAVENIERMTTNLASSVADFLYQRDDDIRALAVMPPSDELYRAFSGAKRSGLTRKGEWVVSDDGMSWVETTPYAYGADRKPINPENNDEVNGTRFHYRAPTFFGQDDVPLYDEIAFIEPDGTVRYQYISPDSPKTNHPIRPAVGENISEKENTYIGAESYFGALKKLKPGEIYVSDVIGAYTPLQYIGMYTIDAMGAAKIKAAYAPLTDANGDAVPGNESMVSLLKQQEERLKGSETLTDVIAGLRQETQTEILSALLPQLEAVIASYNPFEFPQNKKQELKRS
jgi:hypothetical protein